MKLYAPISYYEASDDDKLEICNGCGAKDGIKVPDTMYGLDVSEACFIHDWMYAEGKTLADFYFANAMFLLNLCFIVMGGSKWLAPLRLARATKYFLAVQEWGESAFWVDKKPNKEMRITYRGEFR